MYIPYQWFKIKNNKLIKYDHIKQINEKAIVKLFKSNLKITQSLQYTPKYQLYFHKYSFLLKEPILIKFSLFITERILLFFKWASNLLPRLQMIIQLLLWSWLSFLSHRNRLSLCWRSNFELILTFQTIFQAFWLRVFCFLPYNPRNKHKLKAKYPC